jgi:hypothetical protein
MKIRFPQFLLATALLLSATATWAATDIKIPEERPTLAIVFVENLRAQSTTSDFDRFDLAFRQVARERKWPVNVTAERFGANQGAHEIELRIFHRPLREETQLDLTFRSWMTLTIRGVKHDFGIVTYAHYRRPGESSDEALEKVFRGAALAAADKIEPLLFARPRTAN